MRGIRTSNKPSYMQKVVSLSIQVEHCAGDGNQYSHEDEKFSHDVALIRACHVIYVCTVMSDRSTLVPP